MTNAKKKERKMELTCVGMRHHVTPHTLREMSELTPLRVRLKRDKDNLHDENAISVYCDEKPWKDLHVGYVPRLTAMEVAPKMDAGKIRFTGGYLLTVDADVGMGEMSVLFEKPSKQAKN
jgi:hypothetical protein